MLKFDRCVQLLKDEIIFQWCCFANFLYCLLIITDLDQPNITSMDTRPVEGTTVNLSCDSSGEPRPTISWKMNESPLDTGGNSRISFTDDNKHLTIVNVSRTDSGEYQCVANNSLGNVSSNESTLSVQCKKTFCPLFFFHTKDA